MEINDSIFRYQQNSILLSCRSNSVNNFFFSRFIFNQLEALLSVKFVKQKYLKEFMKKKKYGLLVVIHKPISKYRSIAEMKCGLNEIGMKMV